MSKQISQIFGATLIIAGTCIGVGTLALPTGTYQAGIIPASTLFMLTWGIGLIASFLMLEAVLREPENASLATMSASCFGKYGEIFCWIITLGLLYSLECSYLSATRDLVAYLLTALFGSSPPYGIIIIILTLIFACIVSLGNKAADKLNRVLMLGLGVSYLALVSTLLPHTTTNLILEHSWPHTTNAIAITFAAFGFQIVIPSIRNMLNSNVKHIIISLVCGCTIPLICYLLWETVLLGSIPKTGVNSLSTLLESSNTNQLANLISTNFNKSYITLSIKLFSFFAITTSFIGVSLALFDFLGDGLKRFPVKKIHIGALTFLPPVFIILLYPKAFITALSYAGILSAILVMILPAAIAWRGRSLYPEKTAYITPGRQFTPALIIIIALTLIIINGIP